MTQSKQTPDRSIEYEQYVLGAILLDASIMDDPDIERLSPADFSNVLNETIFATMRELKRDDKPVELVALVGILNSRGEADIEAYIGEILNAVHTSNSAPYYAREIKRLAQVRNEKQALQVAISRLENGESLGEVREYLDKKRENTEPGQTHDIQREPFPVDCFPKVLQNIVSESAQAIDIDPAYIAPHVLSTIAGMIGNTCRIRLKKDWHEPAILWTAVIASSGTGKTPAINAAVDVIRDYQKEWNKEYREECDGYEVERMKYEVALSAWKNKGQKNGDELPAKPDEPTRRQILVDDATQEAIVDLHDENPHGLLIAKDELNSLLAGMDKYRRGGGDEAFYLSLFNGNYAASNRKTGRKSIHLPYPALSICGCIQPGVLQSFISENKTFFSSGFSSRILYSMPPKAVKKWTDSEVCDATTGQYRAIFAALIERRATCSVEERICFRLSDEARRLFSDFASKNGQDVFYTDSEPGAAQRAKFPSIVGRLALVFHVVELIEKHGRIIEESVSGDTMRRAIRLARWFENESLRVLQHFIGDSIQASPPDSDEDKILKKLRERGAMSVREIKRCFSKFNVKGGEERLEAILRELCKSGKVERFVVETGGRQAEKFRLVDESALPQVGGDIATSPENTNK
ncbi:MAG: DUF3987 domain-containing protein [Thermoguttaceae bacterium]